MKRSEVDQLNFNSKVIHAGCTPDEQTGAVIPPIYQTSTYAQETPGVHKGYEYTRSHNPTRTRLEESLATLEKAKYALVTSSGLSAAMLVMHAFKPGAKILCGDDLYGGTYRMFTTHFNEMHQFDFIDTTDLKMVDQKLIEFKPDLIWLETPTNPMLKITDIKMIVEKAKKYKAKVVVDNTFMSPYLQNPIELGADIVMHSMTKYINGHSDVVGGALMTSDKVLYQKLWTLQNNIGPSQSPFDSWLVLRGIKTLGVRMKTHEENARKVAKFLEEHSKVEKVIYPGLKSHPGHHVQKRQANGFGGMITFFIKGGLKESRTFLKKLKLFTLAESLGGVESLIEHPAIMTHASIPKENREKLGILDNMIRISVGIEECDDLINDLRKALG